MLTPEDLGPTDGDCGGTSSVGPTQGGEQKSAAPAGAPPVLAPDFPRHTYYGAKDGPTEFSFGPGQVPQGFETKSPREGGAYRGRTPRADSVTGRLPGVRRGQAYGVPGERLR